MINNQRSEKGMEKGGLGFQSTKWKIGTGGENKYFQERKGGGSGHKRDPGELAQWELPR